MTVARVSGPTRRMPGLPVQLLEDLADRAVPAAGHVDDRGQVLAAEAVHLRRRERVQVDARLGLRHDAQEREQQADLRPGVQAGRPREAPRDAGDVERPQEGVGVAVGPDEDGVVARPSAGGDPAADLGDDPVRLVRGGRERLQRDRGRVRVGPFGAESLADPGAHLEAFRVVEANQPVRRVEDRRLRAVVPAQDDGPCRAIPLAEPEDVVDRGASERIDGLVVVADDGDVPMRLREQADQFGLGAIRVLELIDQDVAEPARDLGSCRRRLAHEAQGERHLVAEVDAAVRRQQRLVGRVRAGELVLVPPLLERGVRRIAVRVGVGRSGTPAASATSAASAETRSANSRYAAGLMSSSLHRLNSVARAARKRVGSPSGRYASSSNSNRCSRRKITTSGRVSTRTSVGNPSSRAYWRMRPSPKAWKVEIAVSV